MAAEGSVLDVQRGVRARAEEVERVALDLKDWEKEAKGRDEALASGQLRLTKASTLPAPRNAASSASSPVAPLPPASSPPALSALDSTSAPRSALGSASQPAESAVYEAEKARGNDFFRKGELQNALVAYSKCTQLDPSNPVAFLNRAQVFLSLGRFEEAVRDSSTVLAADVRNVKALYRRAVARQRLGRFAEALADLSFAQRIEPSNLAVEKLLKEVQLAAKASPQPLQPATSAEPSPQPELQARDAAPVASTVAKAAAAAVASTAASNRALPAATTAAPPQRKIVIQEIEEDEDEEADGKDSGRKTEGHEARTERPAPRAQGRGAQVRSSPPASSDADEEDNDEADDEDDRDKVAELRASIQGGPGAVKRAPHTPANTPQVAGGVRHLHGHADASLAAAASNAWALPSGARTPANTPNVSSAVRHLPADGPRFRTPRTGAEFELTFREIRNNSAAVAEYLAVIPPHSFASVLQTCLEPGVLKTLLDAVANHMASPKPATAAGVLRGLMAVPRFKMLTMFLDANDRKALELIFAALRAGGVDEGAVATLKAAFSDD